MLDFRLVRLFLKVVEYRGVSPAARALDMPRSTASRLLSELEQELGARLVQRSTRSFGLTEAGHLVHREFQRMAEARLAIEEGLRAPSPVGVLRVTAPFSLAMNMIAPVLPAFLDAYPELRVSFDLSVRRADLIGEDFDVAIRAGKIESSALVGRRLGASRFVLVASPTYLAAAGTPDRPEDLAAHAVLAFHHSVELPRSWTFARADERVTVAFEPRLAANDHAILLKAARDGVGVTCLPERLARDGLRDGSLQCCLPEWRHGEAEVYALYPSRRGLSPKVRAFVDHLAATLDFSA